MHLISFLLVVTLYFVILLTQRDSYVCYTMTSTIKNFVYTMSSGPPPLPTHLHPRMACQTNNSDRLSLFDIAFLTWLFL